MSDSLFWSAVFAAACFGGIVALLLLQQSAALDAVRKAGSRVQSQIDDFIAQATKSAKALEELTSTLARNDEQRSALQSELHGKEAVISHLAGFEANHMGLEARLTEMKQVWLDHPTDNTTDNEADCQRVLLNNLWVLSPDYIVDASSFREKQLASIFEEYFPEQAANGWNPREWQVRVPGNRRPDLSGPAKTYGAFGSLPEDIFLIIELKSSGKALAWHHIEQVHGYAFSLMQNVGERLHNSRIECLVIGKECPGDLNDAHLRWGSEPHHAIRIVPLTYRQLYERACQMTKTFREMAFKDSEAAIAAPLGEAQAA